MWVLEWVTFVLLLGVFVTFAVRMAKGLVDRRAPYVVLGVVVVVVLLGVVNLVAA